MPWTQSPRNVSSPLHTIGLVHSFVVDLGLPSYLISVLYRCSVRRTPIPAQSLVFMFLWAPSVLPYFTRFIVSYPPYRILPALPYLTRTAPTSPCRSRGRSMLRSQPAPEYSTTVSYLALHVPRACQYIFYLHLSSYYTRGGRVCSVRGPRGSWGVSNGETGHLTFVRSAAAEAG